MYLFSFVYPLSSLLLPCVLLHCFVVVVAHVPLVPDRSSVQRQDVAGSVSDAVPVCVRSPSGSGSMATSSAVVTAAAGKPDYAQIKSLRGNC